MAAGFASMRVTLTPSGTKICTGAAVSAPRRASVTDRLTSVHFHASSRRVGRFEALSGIFVVAFALKLLGEVRITARGNPALGENMHTVWHDIIEQALIMGDDENAAVR